VVRHPPEKRRAFGSLVRQLRTAAGLRQMELARRCELTQERLGRLERGSGMIRPGELAALRRELTGLAEFLDRPKPTRVLGHPVIHLKPPATIPVDIPVAIPVKAPTSVNAITRYTPIAELPEWLTAEEFAALFDLSPGVVYEMAKSRALPCQRFGKKSQTFPEGRLVRISRATVEQYSLPPGQVAVR
jgi:transcriptional regulator with XRE-family HTH domain